MALLPATVSPSVTVEAPLWEAEARLRPLAVVEQGSAVKASLLRYQVENELFLFLAAHVAHQPHA